MICKFVLVDTGVAAMACIGVFGKSGIYRL